MKSVQTRYGLLFGSDFDTSVSCSLNAYGEWAQNEIWFMENFIPQGARVIDIGAYIGTHTLAFSKFVGQNGTVLSFEPQPEAYEALVQCRERNALNNVCLFDYALSDEERILDIDKGVINDDYQISTPGLNAISDYRNYSKINAKPLDHSCLNNCDFIKIDAKRMEFHALKGAIRTIAGCRPVIFCECNSLASSLPLLPWAREYGYSAYGKAFFRFNPFNYLGNSSNIFGDAADASIILVPQERLVSSLATLNNHGATELKGPDDIAYLLFGNPQYVKEVREERVDSRAASHEEEHPRSPNEGKMTIAGSASKVLSEKGAGHHSTLLVVPFFRNPQLVSPLFESLLRSSAELQEHRVRIMFYNDSPDDLELREELERCLRHRGDLDLTLHENTDNLGFVRTANHAFDVALHDHQDVLLLNSDTVVFPGAIGELFEVAYSDPMIGFVSPRSNNATICSFPHSVQGLDLNPDEAFRKFTSIAGLLPRMSYVPTGVGFCILIKWIILAEFGGFDTAYGKGYNEENDLIMRANRCGYRAALANHAFVWHSGGHSFNSTDSSKAEIGNLNDQILRSRYPEYTKLVAEYYHSPEYTAEKLLETIYLDDTGTITIGFDFSSFDTYHNGTFEAGKRLLASSVECWDPDIQISVFMSEQAWTFHGISRHRRVSRVDPDDTSQKVTAIVRVGQPFQLETLQRLYLRAPVVAIFMLDSISADCGYLRISFDQLVWQFALNWSDVIFTNSKFTSEQLRRRYTLGPRALLVPSLHSVCPAEYSSNHSRPAQSPGDGGQRGRVLVIGNEFEHKAMVPTVERLARVLPQGKVVALGCGDLGLEGVEFIQSGALTDEEMEEVFSRIDAVVFPSHYEGFGFPILHALARSKPIYVRRIPSFLEIAERITVGIVNVYWFESTEELAMTLARGVASWRGPTAVGEKNGWDRSAREVLGPIRLCIQQVRHSHLAERLRWLSAVSPQSMPEDPQGPDKIDLAAQAAGRVIERSMSKAFSYPLIYGLVRFFWRSIRFASETLRGMRNRTK